ncbi:hypothetical protein Pan44_54120 [Caulifigura coniformis]|uniref:Uncharacterized protein n=1 Tax=Caulifigura coniformis TaxID=2527983 RepID=A0A517SMI4_9PLAN|nr:hypothetical protein [Caulifigura coniformis]QDT57344.1 hypothetical protein Pan44_54120 [Caulifigura coniformis]
MNDAPTYRRTLMHCFQLSMKWTTIIYAAILGTALLIPATYRDPLNSWDKLGSAVGGLVVLWLWGLVGAALVSPLAHALARRRRLQASGKADNPDQRSH